MPRQFVLHIFGILLCSLRAVAASPESQPSPLARGPATLPASRPATRAIRAWKTEELVNALMNVGNDQFSVRTNIIAAGKDGEEKLPKGLLMLQDDAPPPAEAMKELVRRGADALPVLLAHLDDARKTRAVVKGMFSGIAYTAEYDLRPQTTRLRPKGVVKEAFLDDKKLNLKGVPEGNEYQLAVGDLCFDLIGQIVNRNFKAVRYQPTAIIIVSSPVLCPDLAAAVRAEWSNLTRAQHEARLAADISATDSLQHDIHGAWTLCDHYPRSLAGALHRRFAMPMFDLGDFEDFVYEVMKIADADERTKKIDAFLAAKGPEAKQAFIHALWTVENSPFPLNKKEVHISAAELLSLFAPGFDPEYGPAVAVSSFSGTADLIEALASIHDPAVDAEVLAMFRRHADRHTARFENEDVIAAECVKHFAGRGDVQELLAFCTRRANEVKEEQGHKRFIELVDLLHGKKLAQ